MNKTSASPAPPGNIDHPFHIHINPFQIVEVFDPHEKIEVVDPDDKTKRLLVDKYEPITTPLKWPNVQCHVDLAKPDTWKDCHNQPQRYRIWWDVFAIPSARQFDLGTTKVIVPGFFRMRSRFVDYPGLYVLHCHILAHEDRGMMLMVRVTPMLAPDVRHH